jgi:hypothetical protein
MVKKEINVEGSEVMLVLRLVARTRAKTRALQGDDVARIFPALRPLLAPVPSPSFSNPPLHRNRFNLLLPLRVFTPSHYSPISYCLILFLFFLFPDTFLIPMFTSHFLESRDENFFLTFLFASLKLSFASSSSFILWPIFLKYCIDKQDILPNHISIVAFV